MVPALDMVLELISSIKLPLTVDSQTGKLALAFVLLHVSLELVFPSVGTRPCSACILDTDVALEGPMICLSMLHIVRNNRASPRTSYVMEERECGVEVYHSVAHWVERAHADGGMTR